MGFFDACYCGVAFSLGAGAHLDVRIVGCEVGDCVVASVDEVSNLERGRREGEEERRHTCRMFHQ